MKTTILSAQDIEKVTDRTGLRKAMARGLKALSLEEARSFPRYVVEIAEGKVMGFMPAFSLRAKLVGYKAAAVFLENRKANRDLHQGLVVLADPDSGRTVALLEASAVTRLRTAAVSAVATEALSRNDSHNLTLIGTGRQAFEHALAIAEVRKIAAIKIYGRSPSNAERLKENLAKHLECAIEVTSDISSALSDFDILVSCTSSPAALFSSSQLPSGTHINAIGACRPGQIEIDLGTRPGLSLFMDSRAACMEEAEEILRPLNSGGLDALHLRGEIGEVLAEKIPGRQSADEITLFKSVGLGIEDVMAAAYILERARTLGLGREIDMEGRP